MKAHPADIAALRRIFGVEGGTPALGWPAVREFESRHRIVLPEPYRTFVAEVAGAHPAGPPAYGLTSLGLLPDDWGADRPEREPAKPFPLTAEWQWETDESASDDVDVEPVFNHGSLVLGTDGCGMYWHLVVTGDQRGQVWLVTEAGATPFGAEFGYTTAGSGFLGWARHWSEGKDWFDL